MTVAKKVMEALVRHVAKNQNKVKPLNAGQIREMIRLVVNAMESVESTESEIHTFLDDVLTDKH